MNDGYAICPFYNSHSDKRIRCEGFREDIVISASFTTKPERKEHYDKYCASFDYEKCPLAKIEREEITDDELIEEISRIGKEVLEFRERSKSTQTPGKKPEGNVQKPGNR